MKLAHLLEAPRMPDPSDYRAGDEFNPRSPDYDERNDEAPVGSDDVLSDDFEGDGWEKLVSVETNIEETGDGPLYHTKVIGSPTTVNKHYISIKNEPSTEIMNEEITKRRDLFVELDVWYTKDEQPAA